MNPIQLLKPDFAPSGVYICGKCGRVFPALKYAEDCCAPTICEKCGRESGNKLLVCDACQKRDLEEAEKRRFEKAKKITEFSGPVFDKNGEYFNNVELLLESYKETEAVKPHYCWTSNPIPIVNVSAGILLDQISDGFDGFDPVILDGVEELTLAIDKFNEVNVKHKMYEVDYSKALILG